MSPRASSSRHVSHRAPRRSLLVVGGGVLLLAVGIAVLTVGGRVETPTVEELAGSPTVDGDPLPAAPADPGDDPAVGTPAPIVAGAGFDGEPVVVGGPGRPRLVAFMAAWCPHCQEELPEVAAWLRDGGAPEGLEVVAVATGLDATRPGWPPDAWFEEVGYPGPVLVDDAAGSVAAAYGLTGTPYWVGLDADGRVVVRVSGRLGTDTVDRLADHVAAAG